MNLNNIKIGTRLSAAFGLLLALLLGAVAAGWVNMANLNGATVELAGNWMPSIVQTNAMNNAAQDLRIAEFEHVLNTDDAKMAALEKQMGQSLAEFDKADRAYIPMISSPEEKTLHDAMLADWKQFLQVHEKVLVLSRKNDNEAARDLAEGEARKYFDAANNELQQLVDLNQKGGDDAAAGSAKVYADARIVMIGSAVLAVLLALACAYTMVRSITGPLHEALQVAEAISHGDLSVAIHVRATDESGLLMGALQRMQSSLVQSVGRVRQGADSVATASAQIAQGNQDLSSRTEQQASALEETAASMEELSAQVKHNADNARQANQLATSASTVAARGGDVVGRVVETMKDINASSRKIADIISVIDGIAFQTNILALNAAVEAARAGDQGRGFAVVASEVRSLAGRSAEAAKEIKTLINASVERVEQGTNLVDEAGTTMGEVVVSIKRVTDLVGEISSASNEQAAGVAQVGEAVTQMDQATQQNAALVEEMAAAASSLQTQASDLVNTVAVFKTDGHSQSAAPAARPLHSMASTTHSPVSAPKLRAAIAAPKPLAKTLSKPFAKSFAKPAAQQITQSPKADNAPAAPRAQMAAATADEDWETF